MSHIRAAFNVQFVIQMVVYALITGIAWGSLRSSVKMNGTLTVKIPIIEQEVAKNTGHREDHDIHMPLDKKLEIFVSKELYGQSQEGLKKDIQALTDAVNELRSDVKELLKTRSGS